MSRPMRSFMIGSTISMIGNSTVAFALPLADSGLSPIVLFWPAKSWTRTAGAGGVAVRAWCMTW